MKFSEQVAFVILYCCRGPFFIANLVILLPITINSIKSSVNEDGCIKFLGLEIPPPTFIFVITSITALATLICLPVLGIFGDKHDKRKIITVFCILFILTVFPMTTLLFRDIWYIPAFNLVFLSMLFEFSGVLYNSYIPVIGQTKREKGKLSSFSTIAENSSTLLYLLILPLLLYHTKPENLVFRGNFDYFNSYSSWSLYDGNSYSKCKDKPYDSNSNTCWRSVNATKNGLHTLNLKLKSNQNVQLMETHVVKPMAEKKYQFTTLLSHVYPTNGTSLNLEVKQLDDMDNILYNKKSLNFDITHDEDYYKFFFKTNPKTAKIIFALNFISTQQAEINIEKVETLTSPDYMQIFAFFIAVVIFSLPPIYFAQKLPYHESQIENNAVSNKKAIKDIFQNLAKNKELTYCLFMNTFWTGGYNMLNTSFVIILNDKFNFGSYSLSICFSVICAFAIIGALLDYFFEKSLGQYNSALFIYFLWTITPLSLLLFGNVSNIVMIFFLGLNGACIGFVYAIKYSIFSNLIPTDKETKYMSLFMFFQKSADLVGSATPIVLLHFIRFEYLIFYSIFFFIIALIFAFLMWREHNKKKTKKEESDSKNTYINNIDIREID